MEEKKEKTGFWASLFSPNPCSCFCRINIIEEFDNGNDITSENSNKEKIIKIDDKDKKSLCEC